MENFSRIELKLKRMGYEVVNPARVNAQMPDLKWSEYMIMSLTMLSLCDTIYMMEGWKESRGAITENKYAKDNNLSVIYG